MLTGSSAAQALCVAGWLEALYKRTEQQEHSPKKTPLPVAQLLAPVLVNLNVPPATVALNPFQHVE